MAENTATAETTVLRVPTTLKSLIEALIFAAQEPLTVKQIQAMYEYQGLNGESRRIESVEITGTVEELNNEYAAADKPYRIVQIAGGYQFATLQVYAEWLGKLHKEQARRKLSQSSIETLAIIAYKQPITKPEIESIRGVNCDYVLKTLLEKELVTIVGRASTVGRPLFYGTTKEFLKHFGLNDVADLPRPREIEEILGESQFETERRMLEAQQGLQEKKEEDFKSRLPHIPRRKPALDEEVKIIPRKRTREIKVRERSEVVHESAKPEPTQDEPVSEIQTQHDQQETAADLTKLVRPISVADEKTIQEESVVGRGIESPERMEVEEPAAQESVEEAKREPLAESEESASDVTGEVERQSVLEDIDTAQSSIARADVAATEDFSCLVPSPAAQQSAVEPEPQLQRPAVSTDQRIVVLPKSRWQSWKEKIQAFVRKLFG